MDFTLPEHVEALRDEVRKFAEKEIRPHVMEWDEAKTFPLKVMKQLGEMGLMGIIFPEEYGGAGMGYLEYAVVVEELSRVDGSVGISIAAHNSLCSNHIYAMGTEAQKQKYLVPLASGKMIGAWGLTEPEAGSDAGALLTQAKKEGSHWVLN
ncbi:MAG: acyl-CoA dehydrogenase family protein, partial [Holophaga sp.]